LSESGNTSIDLETRVLEALEPHDRDHLRRKILFRSNTGIASLENGKIDPKKPDPLHIDVVTLR